MHILNLISLTLFIIDVFCHWICERINLNIIFFPNLSCSIPTIKSCYLYCIHPCFQVFTEMPSEHYLIIAQLLLAAEPEGIPNPQEVKTLVKVSYWLTVSSQFVIHVYMSNATAQQGIQTSDKPNLLLYHVPVMEQTCGWPNFCQKNRGCTNWSQLHWYILWNGLH